MIVAKVEPDRLEVLVSTFKHLYADKLGEPRYDTGKGREGLPDGWINGLGLYRITDMEDLHSNFLDEIIMLGIKRKPAQVVFNRLEPNGKLSEHVDGPPYRERYHLVLTGGYTYFQDGVGYSFEPGNWYGPILYWHPHAVYNRDETRIVMLVDFE